MDQCGLGRRPGVSRRRAEATRRPIPRAAPNPVVSVRCARTSTSTDSTCTTALLKGTQYRWLDLAAMCAQLLPPSHHTIQRIRYFTAKVSARPNRQHDPVHQSIYLRALATLPTVTVHLGHFLTSTTRMPLANPPPLGPQMVEVIKTEEKGSDVNLATYLLADAFRNDSDAFVIISIDSDLTEPLRIVRHELGKVVGLINPQPPTKRSWALAQCRPTFFKQIRAGVLGRSQLPPSLTDRAGTFTKPAGW